MKRAYLLLLAIYTLALFLIATNLPNTLHAGGNLLNVERLSDHSLTEADTFINIYGYEIATSSNIAHFYWQETGNDSEGSDLFYRQVPGGSTIRLSNPALSEGDVNHVWFDTAVSSSGTFHIIWLEDTNTTEGSDLFYWCAATGTIRLSDHTETEGHVQPAQNTLQLVLDSGGNPHTIWYEETGTTEEEDLFYWSQSTGTVRLTDRGQTEGSDVNFGPNKLATGNDNMPHVTWAEYGNDGTTATFFYWNASLANPLTVSHITISIVAGNTAHLFGWADLEGPIDYWNSADQISQVLPSSDDPGGIIFVKSPFADSENTVHLLWSEGDSGTCLSHWNSDTQTTEDLVTGDRCSPPGDIYLGPTNTIHTVVIDEPMGNFRFRYWNSTLTAPIPIPVGNSSNNLKLTGIAGTDTVHLTWIQTIGSDDNYYHWDNFNQITSNLSQLAGSETHISSSHVVPSNDGDLYMLWEEAINGTGTFQSLYWNSATNSTQNLFTELGISSVTSGFEPMRMDLLDSGSPYMMWHGNLDSEPEGLYLWDSVTDTIHLAGASLPCSEIGRSYKNNSDKVGNTYLMWQDDVTGINYFWSTSTGQINLSQTGATETFCRPPVLAVSENGSVFLMWIEESDIAGEGQDFFGGWIEASASSVYLPMVTR